MVDERQLGVPGQDEVAVHRVDGEVVVNRLLRGAERLGNSSAAKDAARAWRKPHGTGVGEEIGVDVAELRQFKHILNGRLRIVDGWGAD